MIINVIKMNWSAGSGQDNDSFDPFKQQIVRFLGNGWRAVVMLASLSTCLSMVC